MHRHNLELLPVFVILCGLVMLKWKKLAKADKLSLYFPRKKIFRIFGQKEEDLLRLFHKMLEGLHVVFHSCFMVLSQNTYFGSVTNSIGNTGMPHTANFQDKYECAFSGYLAPPLVKLHNGGPHTVVMLSTLLSCYKYDNINLITPIFIKL